MKIKNILFITLSVFAFLIVLNIVNAGCCLATNNGEYCVTSDTTVAGCKENMFLSEDCSLQSLCENKGACIFENECTSGRSEIACDDTGGDFEINKECNEIEGFRNICCRVTEEGSGGYDWLPENECVNELGGNVEETIDNEPDCEDANLDPSLRKGCCIKEDGSCVFGLQETCDEEGGFYQGEFFCSDLETQCNPVCTEHNHKEPGQFGDEKYDLYWYDSCDNQEDLAKDCNEQQTPKLVDNVWDCVDAKCDGADLWDNPYTDENHDGNLENDNGNFDNQGRNFRYNGESWCEYQQAKVGPALDLPGTRHYMHYCDHGVERVDVSGEGRNKICVEQDAEFSGIGTIRNATWFVNYPNECFSCNDNTIVSDSDIQACCASKTRLSSLEGGPIGCTYIERKDLTGDNNKDLFFTEDKYAEILNGKQSAEWVKLIYVDPETGEDIHTVDYKDVVEEIKPTTNCECKQVGATPLCLYECNCINDICAIRIKDVPEGTWRLDVKGKGCGSFGQCKSGRFTLGELAMNAPKKGVCVPLVPPSTEFWNVEDSSCKSFGSKENLSAYTEFNDYYAFPLNNLGTAECENLFDCLNKNILTSTSAGAIVADNYNTLCKSWGDCGAGYNIAGRATKEGFVTNPTCVAISGEEQDVEDCPKPQVSDININKYQKLRNGEPTRPEDFLPIFVPFLFFRRRFKKKFLFLALIALLLILAGCGDSDPPEFHVPPPTQVTCNSWQAPAGNSDCSKCSKTVDEGGLLPVNSPKDPEGNPYYTCYESLCKSLGAGCQYVETINGPDCIKSEEYANPKIIIKDAAYTCSSLDASGCVNGNYNLRYNEANSPSNKDTEIEINGKLEPYEPVTVNFKTVDVNIEPFGDDLTTRCEYSYNVNEPGDDLPYPDGGLDGIDHTLYLTGGILSPGHYDVFVTCTNPATVDPDLTELSDTAVVRFTISEGRDLGPPVIKDITPAVGNAYVKHNVSTKVITLYTEGNVDHCRWDNENVNFEDMGKSVLPDGTEEIENIFGCTRGGAPGSDSNICEAVLDGIVEGENRFWFACKGTNDLVSDPWPSDGYLVIGSHELNITNVNCRHSLGNDCATIYDNAFDFSIETTGGAQGGQAGCMWSVGEYDYDIFDEPGGEFLAPEYGLLHKEINYSHDTGLITIKFLCEDIAENVARNSVNVSIERDITSPKINKVYRVSDNLLVETNEASNCYYVENLTASFDNAVQFSTSNKLIHSTNIIGNFYKVRCEDLFNNKKDADVYINKI